jgi:hypothetical protein
MFAATPRLRDRLDVRTVVLVGGIALGAFGLQLAFLAGTFASPLGGAIADFDRIPQVDRAPPEALARASDHARPERDADRAASLPWERSPAIAVGYRSLPLECPVYR